MASPTAAERAQIAHRDAVVEKRMGPDVARQIRLTHDVTGRSDRAPDAEIAAKRSEIDEAGAIVAERMGVLRGHVRKSRHAAGRIDAIRLARRSAECPEVQ